jgi:predicted O-linked N-acetylglucosamine transferase (SPINDLY family)
LLEIPDPASASHVARSRALRDLSRSRRELATQWLALPQDKLAAAFAGDLGGAHQQLMSSGIRDAIADEADREYSRQLADGLKSEDPAQPHPGRILAAMLYLYPHELPRFSALPDIPSWLLQPYLEYMLAMPAMFRQPGEAEALLRFTESWFAYLHDNVVANIASPLWRSVGRVVLQKSNFMPLYFNSANLRKVYQLRAGIMEATLAAAGYPLDHLFPPRPARGKLRLGILAAHYLPQTETFAALPVYDHIDRDRFEVTLFTLQAMTGHPLEKYCASRAEHVVALQGQVPQKAQQIRAADLDLIFLGTNATAATNEFTALAMHRLARVQVAGVASCVSTGMRNVDCYLSGRRSEPANAAQDHYSERLFMVDGPAHCYDFATETLTAAPPAISRESVGIPAEAVVFISGANFYKLIPELYELWMRILAATPGSRLVLYPFNPNWSAGGYPAEPLLDRLAAAMARHGISAQRLLVFPAAPGRAEILQRLKLGDLYLDSFPFSGATSLLDPLEAGIPPVVMDGTCFRNLMAPAILRELGIPELVAADAEAYVALAIRLAADGASRRKLAERISAGMRQRPRFLDSHWYAEQAGEKLLEMWKEFGPKA